MYTNYVHSYIDIAVYFTQNAHGIRELHGHACKPQAVDIIKFWALTYILHIM